LLLECCFPRLDTYTGYNGEGVTSGAENAVTSLISSLDTIRDLIEPDATELLPDCCLASVTELQRVWSVLRAWSNDSSDASRARRARPFIAGNIIQQDAAEWYTFLEEYFLPGLSTLIPQPRVYHIDTCTNCESSWPRGLPDKQDKVRIAVPTGDGSRDLAKLLLR
jgi:hypothetical protein